MFQNLYFLNNELYQGIYQETTLQQTTDVNTLQNLTLLLIILINFPTYYRAEQHYNILQTFTHYKTLQHAVKL